MCDLAPTGYLTSFDELVCDSPAFEEEDTYTLHAFLQMLERTTRKEEGGSRKDSSPRTTPVGASRSFDSQTNLETFLDLVNSVFTTVKNGDSHTGFDVKAINRLEAAMTNMTASDFGVSEEDVPYDSIGFKYVYEHRDFTIMMMLFPAGVSIPCHDHPEMIVFSKVLFGEVQVSSFDPKPACKCGKNCFDERFVSRPVHLRRNREVWTPESGTLRTLMEEGNLHQFHATKASCIIDVMSPPYSEEDGGPRECSYYRIGPSAQGCLYAVQVDVPDDYYTVRLPFDTRRGPGIVDSSETAGGEGAEDRGLAMEQATEILTGLTF
uniref:Cysteine dioxygenase n=1 Tax=Hemiselmis andersenii TaxID=464988 RepID=A0A6U2C0G2_HEMAN